MHTNAILQADIIDIIFDKKNKMYGAYTLRKFYNNRLFKSLGIVMGLVALFFLSSFFISKKVITNITTMPGTTEWAAPPTTIPKKKILLKKLDLPKALAIAKPAPTQAFTQVKLTLNTVVPPVEALKDLLQISDVSKKGDTKIDPIITSPKIPVDSNSVSGKTEPAIKEIDKLTPNEYAEVMPAYKGGMQALRLFLQNNLQSPTELDEGETISVIVKFIVGYDGKLKGFEIVQDGGTLFNNEVIRVLKKMPNWIPGKSKGQNVSVFFNIPVKFNAST